MFALDDEAYSEEIILFKNRISGFAEISIFDIEIFFLVFLIMTLLTTLNEV
jgi:hypothetical protein